MDRQAVLDIIDPVGRDQPAHHVRPLPVGFAETVQRGGGNWRDGAATDGP